jgi:formiminotetrahydrofolate cyclodeaminase
MSMTQEPIEEFLNRLASADPTPGGGSAAAIMGAAGAALVSMVCNVSIGKKGCEAAEPELRGVFGQSETLRRRLTAMVQDDVSAFDGLMAAYKLPKGTEDDKARRTEAIQVSLKRATQVPLECARACGELIALARSAGEHGYQHVISDAGVGVSAAYAGLRSAALNVFINAPALRDRGFASQTVREIERLLERSAGESESVYALVRAKLAG